MVTRSQPDYRFDFCGGHPAIDFTNTVGSRFDEPDEHFRTFGDLLAWADAAGVLTSAEAAKVRRAAERDPGGARRAVGRAVELREALYGVFAAIAERRTPPADALARLNDAIAETYRTAHLEVAGRKATLATPSSDPLGVIAAAVVRTAVDLLTSDAAVRIGRCADETCGWLFVDNTRSRTRRWCDMKSCGNRAKVRRFRAT